MKTRLLALLFLVLILCGVGSLLFSAARKAIRPPDVAERITMENGIETHHFTVTAKRL
jgi:hypothetical protein